MKPGRLRVLVPAMLAFLAMGPLPSAGARAADPEVAKLVLPIRQARLANGLTPVSYTHLDVYKRQVEDRVRLRPELSDVGLPERRRCV